MNTSTRTSRRAHTKNRAAQKLKIAAYYENFRGGDNRHNRANLTRGIHRS